MKVKHNFLDLVRTENKRAPWMVPLILAAGILLGAATTAAVLIWVVPMKDRVPTITEQPVETPQEDPNPIVAEDAYLLDVAWHENPRQLTEEQMRVVLLAGAGTEEGRNRIRDAYTKLTTEGGTELDGEPWWSEVGVEGMWDVGEVQGDVFKGATIYHLRLSLALPGGGYQHVYIVRPQDGSTNEYVVGGIPSGYEDYEEIVNLFSSMTLLPNATISGLEMPDSLVLENGKMVTADGANPWPQETYRFDGMDELRQVTQTKEGVPVYEYREQSDTHQAGCLFVFAADGRRVQYRSVIPREVQEYNGDQGRLLIQWDNEEDEAEMGYMERLFSGCGGFACAAIVSEQDAEAGGGLTKVGEAEKGDPVYAPSRPQSHPVVKELYDGWYIPDGGDKPSITEMLNQYPVPIFYWQDALGRWVEYRAVGILPLAECGKPVIYLYPEQPTDVSVRLPSFINVTVSDPTYPTNGWRVTAQPNGQLTSHADGNTYGSLYWEGTGVGYAPPKDGFIVKDGDVESFLRNILPKYGLNETEAREFMEFWLPEMQGAPYYRVSFLTSAWSNAAPLYVSPRPQTSIRIFMDWKPLSAPMSLPEPKIITPARTGFTLVEWGGTLWK